MNSCLSNQSNDIVGVLFEDFLEESYYMVGYGLVCASSCKSLDTCVEKSEDRSGIYSCSFVDGTYSLLLQ